MHRLLKLALLAVTLTGTLALAADPIVPGAAAQAGAGELRYDLSLSSTEQTKFVLWSAAQDLKARLLPNLIMLAILGGLIFRYGKQLWLRFTDREIGRRGLIVMVLMLVPLSYTANVVAWSTRAAFGEVPPQALAIWKFGTDDMSKVPTYRDHSAAIPK